MKITLFEAGVFQCHQNIQKVKQSIKQVLVGGCKQRVKYAVQKMDADGSFLQRQKMD